MPANLSKGKISIVPPIMLNTKYTGAVSEIYASDAGMGNYTVINHSININGGEKIDIYHRCIANGIPFTNFISSPGYFIIGK